jgi:predicted O-methyltransferase YrrM
LNWLDDSIDWMEYAKSHAVEGFMHPSELAVLVRISEGKDYLEVGSYRGLSAWCVAHTARHVTAIDTFRAATNGQFQESQFTTLNEFRKNLEPFDEKLTCLPMSSERAHELLPNEPNFDVIFLDAMHDYDNVLADIQRWWPRVKAGGYLCLHDYRHWDFPGVERAADEVFGPAPEGTTVVTLRWVQKDG